MRTNTVILAAALAALCLNGARAADQPTYQDGVLTVPRVDTTEQVGQYQDASYSLQADGSWKLDGLRSFSSGLTKIPLETVEVVKTDGFPAGVYLRTTGWVWPCGYRDKARMQQRQVGAHFDVAISVPVLVSDEPYACATIMEYVRLTIPLQVYGLAAGTYTYSVNGVSGSFTLDSSNKFADDCRAGTVEPSYTVNWCPQ